MSARRKDWLYVSGKKYDGMMGRCYRDTDRSFPRYGGRGIRVASEWIKDINTFREWLKGQVEALQLDTDSFCAESSDWQLDRIDVDGHYTPNNCRLVSPQKNARNKKNVRQIFLSAEGEEIIV